MSIGTDSVLGEMMEFSINEGYNGEKGEVLNNQELKNSEQVKNRMIVFKLCFSSFSIVGKTDIPWPGLQIISSVQFLF